MSKRFLFALFLAVPAFAWIFRQRAAERPWRAALAVVLAFGAVVPPVRRGRTSSRAPGSGQLFSRNN